jgi:quercetin dioxygenase-like cupin family protein
MPGCRNVEGQGLLSHDALSLALLRFGPEATIHEHAAPNLEIDVLCLEGQGFTSVGDETTPLHAGERVRWPAGERHCLWTAEHPMLTLMVERRRA